MKPRTSIFDSRSEHEVFDAISGSWEPQYRLYPHVPYANLVELDQHRLSADELSFLHRTTVDFVLVGPNSEPLLGIEFDGLGHGISRKGHYLSFLPTKRDPARPWKLQLKVRVANEAYFPFLVLSYDEKAVVDPDTNLIVLHGIVGSFLTSRNVPLRIAELVKEHEDRLSELTPEQAQDEIQDMVLAAEIDLEMEWNPVVRRSVELQSELLKVDGSARWGYSYLEDPPRPANCYPHLPNFDGKAFRNWWDNIVRLGCEYTVKTQGATVRRKVWMRNYEGVGLTPFGLLEELAGLVAFREALAAHER